MADNEISGTLHALGAAGDAAAVIAAVEAREFVKTELTGDWIDPVVLTTPDSARRDLVDLEVFGDWPRRSIGTSVVYSAESFVELFQKLTGEDAAVVRSSARIYADEPHRALIAVLNDDTDEVAGWRDRRIELQLRPTPEWEHWTSRQGLRDQQTFAETIEEGLKEIVSPSAAEMLELAQSFQASVSAKFKQGGQLSNGRRQFTYEEDIQASAGNEGQIIIPGEFRLSVTPFIGGEHVDITARLRYRLPPAGGALTIGYKLDRPHEAELAAFEAIRDAVGTHLGPPIDGIPPTARAAAPLATKL